MTLAEAWTRATADGRWAVCCEPRARVAAVAATPLEAAQALEARLTSEAPARGDGAALAMMFTGQGSQSIGMGAGLLVNSCFRENLRRWCAALSAPSETPLLETMHGDGASEEELAHTWNAQRALFALEVSLAAVWAEAGVRPAYLIGHSIGELSAAYVAGVLSARDAAELVRIRAKAMGRLPSGGAMVAVRAGHADVAAVCGPLVNVAAINGSRNTVISGPSAAVAQVQDQLESAGIACQRLAVSHAFHSAAMEPMLDELRDGARRLEFARPQIPLVSNVTGELMDDPPGPEYWAEHARAPVRYAHGLDTLRARGVRVFLELGPGPVLKRVGERSNASDCVWLSSLDPAIDASYSLLRTATELYERGMNVDWSVLLGR